MKEVPKKTNKSIKKFKGLPRHIVRRAKDNIMANSKNVPQTVEWLNSDFGINCTADDVTALVPVF